MGDRRSFQDLAPLLAVVFDRCEVVIDRFHEFHRRLSYAKRNNSRRNMNRLTSAQVTFNRCAFLARPR